MRTTRSTILCTSLFVTSSFAEERPPRFPELFALLATERKTEFPLVMGYRRGYTARTEDGDYPTFLESWRGYNIDGRETTWLKGVNMRLFWRENLYLAHRDEKLETLGIFGDPDRYFYRPPFLLIDSTLRAGHTWKAESRYRSGDFALGYRAKVVRREKVEAPAGKLAAWVIEYTLTAHLGTENDFRAWFGPGSRGASNSRRLRACP